MAKSVSVMEIFGFIWEETNVTGWSSKKNNEYNHFRFNYYSSKEATTLVKKMLGH